MSQCVRGNIAEGLRSGKSAFCEGRVIVKSAIILMLCWVNLPLMADPQWLPASRHQQFQTFALFADENTGFLIRESGKGWGALGGAVALVEMPDWKMAPQLVLFGSVNTGFRDKTSIIDFATETMDARFGLSVEGSVNPHLRFSAGLVHYSGHAVDGILDASLIPPNLGMDQFFLRVIFDYADHWRVGASFKPVLGSDPGTGFFAADQFIECFPFGVAANAIRLTPFIAVALDEGAVNYAGATFHVQLGVYAGGHTQVERMSTVRFVIGWYTGSDPRLKYAAFMNSKATFVYGGVLFNI